VRASLQRFAFCSDYFELGNELNPHDLPEKQREAAIAYVKGLLRPFRRIVKDVKPTAKVMNHGLGGIQQAYLEAFGEAGGFDLVDAISVHPGFYPRAPEWDEGGEFWA